MAARIKPPSVGCHHVSKMFHPIYCSDAKKKGEMVPCMVSHLHTVLKLFQKAPGSMAWLEYDTQFRMEMAASEVRTWIHGSISPVSQH